MVVAGSLISAVRKRHQATEETLGEGSEVEHPANTPHPNLPKGLTLPKPKLRATAQPKTFTSTPMPKRETAPSIQPKHSGRPLCEVTEEERSEFVRNFDPEKAIIYSEIMRPKYQDWE